MADIDEVIDLLEQANVLEIGDSPWRTYSDNDDVYPLDWDRLVENGDGIDGYFRELDGEFDEVLGRPSDAADKTSQSPAEDWDICGWYQPIHFFGHGWGIFVLEKCVFDTALRIARLADRNAVAQDLLRKPFSLAHMFLRASFLAFYYHEHFHHRIECLGLRLHVATGQSCYPQYSHNVYRTNLNSDHLLEEALANANSYLQIARHKKLPSSVSTAAGRYLELDFPRNPPGYRMAMRYLRRQTFDDGENVLQGQVKEGTLAPSQPNWQWNVAPNLTRSFFNIASDIWVVVPHGARPRLPVGALPKTCSRDDLIKLFKACGWNEDRGAGKGSHTKLTKPGELRPIIVPHGRSLSPGVVGNALKRLGKFKLYDLPGLLNGSIPISS